MRCEFLRRLVENAAGRLLRLPLLVSIALVAAAGPPAFGAVPTGFVDEVVRGGFVLPIAVAFDGTGRTFVVEKRGVIRVLDEDGDLLPTPLLDLTGEVHDAHDKGMLGFALHPNFASNGFIYVLYNVDPVFGQPDEPGDSITWGRLTRYTVSANFALPASRLVLLGSNASNGIANCHSSHSIGTLAFGSDGSLFVGSGDGAHYDFTDGGEDVTPFDPDCEDTFGGAQDLGAFRSQSFETLAGKILRVNPANGQGYSTNPFWDGSPTSFASRVWAIGLRNPFRFTVRPNTPPPGTLYIGDVGWGSWEEMNVAYGGENFGWPCWEGPFEQSDYQSHPVVGPSCDALESGAITPPLVAWSHSNPGSLGFVGSTTSGACFYGGTQFPVQYRGRLFFADYTQGWIRVAEVDSADGLVSLAPFGEGLGAPVDVKMDPVSGDLVYISISEGALRRVRWILGNVPPIVQASANPSAGAVPLLVQFSSDGTFDPNGDPITLEWDFGDGSPPTSAANPQHTYTTLGTFTARLIAMDGSGLADTAEVVVETQNQPPSVAIVNPEHASTFQPNEQLLLSADAFDHEDGGALEYSWTVQLIHNEHLHPGWFTSTETNPLFTAAGHGGSGDRYSYRILVEVTDSGGLAAADTSVILPASLGVNETPIAAIEASPFAGAAPLVVQFSGEESVDPDADYLLYEWNFGDGTSGHGANTTHIYGQPGLYAVTLKVTDPVLASDTATASILVEPGSAIAVWRLDDGSGGTAIDESGGARHATLGGGPAWITGVHGGALDFDGSNDAATAAGSGLLSGRSAFTLAAWIRPGSTGNRIGLIGQNDAIEFGFISAGTVQVWTPGGSSLTIPYPFAMNEWRHIAATGDGTALRIYYDGVLAGATFASTSNYGSSADPLRFGGGGIFDATGNHFDGAMDDVRVYGVALSEETLAILAASPPPNETPVVGAGADFAAGVGVQAALLGSVADDGHPAPPGLTTVTWTQVAGPGLATIANPDRVFTLVSCPEVGVYVFRLTADDGALTAFDEVAVNVVEPTSVGGVIAREGLLGVGPNPMSGRGVVAFGIARDAERVRLAIHDISGRRIATLLDEAAPAGDHRAEWSGRDDDGGSVAAGIYFVVLDVDGRQYTEKLTLLR